MELPEYTIRRSSKSRHIRLRVTPKEGLCVIVPKGSDESIVPSILRRKKAWIEVALKQAADTRRFLEPAPATHLPASLALTALGETWTITYKSTRHLGLQLRAKGDGLLLSGKDLRRDLVIRKLKEWLRQRVRSDLFPIARKLAASGNIPLRELLVKSQRTRWASCSAQKNIALNTKMLFLRPELVRYVLVHELCHTIYMNHSKQFWHLLGSKEPRFRALDRELRQAWKSVPQWVF